MLTSLYVAVMLPDDDIGDDNDDDDDDKWAQVGMFTYKSCSIHLKFAQAVYQ